MEEIIDKNPLSPIARPHPAQGNSKELATGKAIKSQLCIKDHVGQFLQEQGGPPLKKKKEHLAGFGPPGSDSLYSIQW